jgi:hypothetical protein
VEQPRLDVGPQVVGGAQPAVARKNVVTRNSGGAYLALPQSEVSRQQFLDNFLGGGWIRYFAFTRDDTIVMYYSLQPGRYGALFPGEGGIGTAVMDMNHQMVLYVPFMTNDSTNRANPHPHVQTFYEEEVRLMSLVQANRLIPNVVEGITSFVEEMTRLRREGLTTTANHSAYIDHPHASSVSADTRFVYVRKVFPDPGGSFTLFRLSNLRSQVISNTMLDIRWQSDRMHNVGQKYYVHSDGSAEPFTQDHTGILSQVEIVLSNSYRHS